jgi:hypothetical protein
MTDDVDAILGIDPFREKAPETVPTEEGVAGPESPGQPVVVIQYRTRGLPWYLVLPMLVLVALGAVSFYHNFLRSRSRLVPVDDSSPTRNPGKARPAELASSGPVPPNPFDNGPGALALPFGGIPGPLSLNSQPLPKAVTPAPGTEVKSENPVLVPAAVAAKDDRTSSGPPAGMAAPGAAKMPPPTPPTPVTKEGRGDHPRVAPSGQPTSRPDERVPLAVGFSVPTDEDNPFSVFPISRAPADRKPSEPPPDDPAMDRAEARPETDHPVPTRDQVFDEIRAEADEKKAELKEVRGLKERAREEVAAESLQRLEAQRVDFRQQLEEILKSGSPTMGKEIDELCDKFGRAYDPLIRKKASYVLSHLTGKLTLQTKVKVLRKVGVPEPGVLDFLANELHHYVNSRNGPRDKDDVRVHAARQLLLMRLPRNATASTAENQTSQPPR